MRRFGLLSRPILLAACLPVVCEAQTIVFQENFDGGTGTGRFDSYLAGGDGTFDANYNYGAFQYKLYPDYINQPDVFTSQPIPAAPGGTSTTGLRVSVDDTSGAQSNLQLLPKAAAGGNVTVSPNFKISFDMWINYNGGNGGGANSTEHMAAGLNFDGAGVAGFAPGGTRANGYLFTATGEGGNSGDYRINNSDAGDDGPTYEKINANWTGVREIDYDHVTGAYIGGGVNPDEAQNSYFETLFPTGIAETPGAPGKQWVHVDIAQHGTAADYSLNGHHVATLFLSDAFSGVPSFGLYDRNTGSAGADEPDQFMLYDNISVTQFGALSKFTAASGNFADASNWSNGVPGGADQDAVFDGASGAANVNVASAVTLRSLVFNSTNSYTVGGAGPINLSAETNDLIANAGAHMVTAPVNVTGHLSIYNRDGSTLTLTNLSTDPTRFVSKTGAGTLAVNKIRAMGITLTTGELQLLPNGGTSKVGAMVLTGSNPTLDITNDAVIVDYTLRTSSSDPTVNNSPFLGYAMSIVAGFNGGNWSTSLGSGSFITSSTAASVAADSNNIHKTGVGYAEAATLFGPGGGMFNGEAVDGDAVLIKYTLLGDANLDGKVNALDFNILATNFGSPNLTLWSEGDTNYDGVVDTNDFTMLGINFGQVLASPALGTIAPEPGVAVMASMLVMAGLRRRRAS